MPSSSDQPSSERRHAPRRRRQRRAGAVDHEADRERPPAAPDVAHLAAGDHQRGHHERVQRDHRLDRRHVVWKSETSCEIETFITAWSSTIRNCAVPSTARMLASVGAHPAHASIHPGWPRRSQTEGERFELSVRQSDAQRFSRPPHSTALPPLQVDPQGYGHETAGGSCPVLVVASVDRDGGFPGADVRAGCSDCMG